MNARACSIKWSLAPYDFFVKGGVDFSDDVLYSVDMATGGSIKSEFKMTGGCGLTPASRALVACEGQAPQSLPQLQRARNLSNYMDSHLLPPTCWASPKRNGIFGSIDLGGPLLSREGNRFPGFEALEAAAQTIMVLRGLSFIRGELWSPDMSFQEIQGLVRSGTVTHKQKARIELHVFAVGGRFKKTSQMIAAIPHAPEVNIHAMPYTLIKTSCIEAQHQAYLNEGHEGIMLRHPVIAYAPGETSALYKLKPVKEADFIITGYYEGKGHLTGMLGGVTFEGTVDGHPVRSKVGTGFVKTGEADSRTALWQIRHTLPGQTIEVEFDSLTDRLIKGCYALRHSRYGKLKQDRGSAALSLFN